MASYVIRLLALESVFVLGLANQLTAQEVQGSVLETDGWQLSSTVETGNAESLKRITENHFELSPREDPIPIEVQKTGPISNYVVTLEVSNQKPRARLVILDVRIPEWLLTEGFDYFLRKPYWQRSPDKLDWRPIDPRNQVSHGSFVRLQLTFAPLERRIVSTVASYPYSSMVEQLERLETLAGGAAQTVKLGNSAQGRPILALEMGSPDKDRAVFVATTQPGEPSAWAILAMAGEMISNRNLSPLLREYDLSFIPMPNPDGVVVGANNVTGTGEVAIFGFGEAAADQPAPAESEVLWRYLSKKPPKYLIDFHFLELPNHPLPSVYIFSPELFSDVGRRESARMQARRLERLSGVHRTNPIEPNHPLWKHLVTYNAIVKWNTLANLYQYTGPATSHRDAQTRGVQVLRTVLDPTYRQ